MNGRKPECSAVFVRPSLDVGAGRQQRMNDSHLAAHSRRVQGLPATGSYGGSHIGPSGQQHRDCSQAPRQCCKDQWPVSIIVSGLDVGAARQQSGNGGTLRLVSCCYCRAPSAVLWT